MHLSYPELAMLYDQFVFCLALLFSNMFINLNNAYERVAISKNPCNCTCYGHCNSQEAGSVEYSLLHTYLSLFY